MQGFAETVTPYAHTLGQFIAAQAVLAPLLLLFVEEAGLPLLVPGDVILAFVGYNISLSPRGSLLLATVLATVAVAAGSTILFFVARRWGNMLVSRVGKFLFIRQADITRAESLFKRYGAWTILIGRHIPGMRLPLTIFAGISGMPYRVFITSTLASTILWIALFLQVGHHYGRDFERIIQHSVTTSVLVITSIVIVFVGMHFWGRWRRERRS